MENQPSGRGSAPAKQRSNMSNWKSGLEYLQNPSAPATSKRYDKRANFDPKKRGTFVKRVSNVEDAPHLMSVVNAKAEIKHKAKTELTQRAKMKEEKIRISQQRKARIIVDKPSPKQAKGIWTNALSKRTQDPLPPVGPSKKMAKKKASSFQFSNKRPSSKLVPKTKEQAIADWKVAYEEIKSPASGKPKMVARQDLSQENKIMSPKKKTHSSPPKPKLPTLDLEHDDFEDKEEELDVVPEPMEVVHPVTPAKDTKPREEPPSTLPEEEWKGYVDIDSERSESMHDSRQSITSDPGVAGAKSGRKQLILEFSLEPEDGEADDQPGLQVPIDIQSFDELSSVGSWPSIDSKDSYDTRMNKMMQRWMDVHGSFREDEQTIYDNDVDLEDNVLDHIVLAAPDLSLAMLQFEEMSGIMPTPVGPLQGLGAKTAHIGLDGNRYLEIVAPDLENPGPLGEELEKLPPGTLTPYYYSIRSSEVTRLIEGYVYDVLGWDPDHIAMVQALPDNSIRNWDMLTMYGHDVGGVAPCYVNWKDPSQHPTATIALNATLTTCTVRAPKHHDVHKLITGVGGIHVEYGAPLLECILGTPKGPLTFSTPNPAGLVFPGFDDNHQISDVDGLLPALKDRDSNAVAVSG
eukprot:Nitzschia sp. Nitz4//scaffold53_size117307//75085//76980//NITZ4_003774-RA/size117307-processed-gene-0.135-mRNA-1//1//CDS//3329554217//3269//frame0